MSNFLFFRKVDFFAPYEMKFSRMSAGTLFLTGSHGIGVKISEYEYKDNATGKIVNATSYHIYPVLVMKGGSFHV